MSGKTVWPIIFGLVIINCFTLAYFLSKDDSMAAVVSGKNQESESIAVVGKKEITREDWMAELEERFGKETLEEMINFTVVEELAEKHSIKIPEEELDRELTIYKSMYNSLDNEHLTDTKELREQIRYSILLEELLTKDVEISDKELKAYYDSNKDLYSIEDSYHLFHIVTKTEKDALKVIEELKGGSSFEALASEKSIDEFTANEGGDLGFVSENNDYLPSQYVVEAEKLKVDEWSKPIKSDLGYSVLLLKEKLDGVQYSYEDVKNQMRRQIALEQMESAVSVKPLWEEAGVTWFYGDNASKE
ncbi:peptidyl-prolyl cis-trans isomerase [Metabacillus idriensis]|uniref:peptidylprolyl isomerase n=1 Tax=Metabacillus idriensis TaxID=324768 RepID=A0A6I2MHV4_9BACI|nr:peptidyl-prolyl cis-trans isomerase [Metabacillus idriensis]MCM3598922.1 peptidyl-prolyl cis-trans isomerase [Metabacillus idriensis]MRX56944.1 peptidylprolyl isomerase [Metabacillus idriensis]OHR64193.1 peptidylprolyl isomerase [Bacillus sp. HMSC76G11]